MYFADLENFAIATFAQKSEQLKVMGARLGTLRVHSVLRQLQSLIVISTAIQVNNNDVIVS